MRPARYTRSARFYDAISAEPVYRPGRLAAVEALRLAPGMRVLDLGCGTGLNLPLLVDAVGATGQVVGVDASAEMLDQVKRRADQHGWDNVELVQADAATVDGLAGFDAVLATYALSIVSGWERAWARMLAAAAPGARVAVVDMRLPDPSLSFAIVRAPLARLACRLAGSDIHAYPWTALERDCTDVTAVSLRGGHVQVRVGTVTVRPSGAADRKRT